ncbi:hypothetical protein [Photobacterium aquimaris]|uniref:Uncharacterized protein n=1 Tax=Photobacterium aquimaris TaxID=512643 RepID=A0A2T3HWD6_9GAMM|nr:hypothetical protein [Photobacterium aquimaris]OBU22237.1 hypothetical protein AYY21_03155 [Photobacterium aquimaris]PQJ38285.1 hypothetical protein BTN98_12620 [Photobacterium aquimaris]PSU03220.1 hypothetical protein C0W81_12470 [Photobacterium aquimaris]
MSNKSNHIQRRLGFLKVHKMECQITTISGAKFIGIVASFDDTSIVLCPVDNSDPADLMTISMFGLESITSINQDLFA